MSDHSLELFPFEIEGGYTLHDIRPVSVKLPEHLLANEEHGRFHGKKGYIATTVNEDCVLSVSLSLAARDISSRKNHDGTKK
jgi:hypothetical protein